MKKLIVPVALILLGLVGLIVMGIVQGGVPELQVAQLLEAPGAHGERAVKVHGHILRIDSADRPLRFAVADKADPTKVMEVWSDSTRPDTFQETYDVAVQGVWSEKRGRFEADMIFTKCPSKYEADDKNRASEQARGGEQPDTP